MNLRIKDT